MSIEIKTPEQLRKIQATGLVVAEGLCWVQETTAVGVTTAEIDAVGQDVLAEHGVASNFLNYGSEYGTPLPGMSCISVNDRLIHGTPGDQVIRDGDLVSTDFGAVLDGWRGDATHSFVVGKARAEDFGIIEAAQQAMWAGIAVVRNGGRIGGMSRAVEQCVKRQPHCYGLLHDCTGCGIDSQVHIEPGIPNRFRFRPNLRLGVEIAIAVEPMLTLGSHQTVMTTDNWTMRSRDGERGAHWGSTVAVTEHGLWMLTEPDGGEAELTMRDVIFRPLNE